VTVTVIRREQLCHDDRSFIMDVTHLALVSAGLGESAARRIVAQFGIPSSPSYLIPKAGPHVIMKITD